MFIKIIHPNLPFVQVQKFTVFLAFDLCFHHIPVIIMHTPPCCRVLAGKQTTHGSVTYNPSCSLSFE